MSQASGLAPGAELVAPCRLVLRIAPWARHHLRRPAGKGRSSSRRCDQVPGARGWGQGTETPAKLGGLPAVHSFGRHQCHVRIRFPATSDRQFGRRLRATRAPNGAECDARSGKPFPSPPGGQPRNFVTLGIGAYECVQGGPKSRRVAVKSPAPPAGSG
jgi:hypothetical protein